MLHVCFLCVYFDLIQYHKQANSRSHGQFRMPPPPPTSPNRKILNDLSSDAPAVPRIEEEKAEEDSTAAAAAATPAITTVTVPTPIYQTSSGQYSAFSVTVRVLGH